MEKIKRAFQMAKFIVISEKKKALSKGYRESRGKTIHFAFNICTKHIYIQRKLHCTTTCKLQCKLIGY